MRIVELPSSKPFSPAFKELLSNDNRILVTSCPFPISSKDSPNYEAAKAGWDALIEAGYTFTGVAPTEPGRYVYMAVWNVDEHVSTVAEKFVASYEDKGWSATYISIGESDPIHLTPPEAQE